MELLMVNQVLIKLLLLALNLMPLDQAAFNFHILRDGMYTTTYRVERRDQDFTIFRPRSEDAAFPAFDAERSRRFGRSYIVRVQNTGEIATVVLTDILRDMPPLASVPRQVLKTRASVAMEFAADTVPAAGATIKSAADAKPVAPAGAAVKTEAAAKAPANNATAASKQAASGTKTAADSKPAGSQTTAEGAGDIRIDGVGRTLFLTVDGQNFTIVAEINASL